jgi:ABC-2 type transport system ATP-binding protein
MELAIEIQNLCKEYPGRTALKNVSFIVKKGSVHGFLGPNGAGKSTTMKILSGLIAPTSGDYKAKGKIGFLPEHPPVYPHMSVEEYLFFVLEIYSASKKSASDKSHKETVSQVLSKTGLTDVRERLIGNLSKGYQQRVGIAQAIIHSPEIIILDEPTVGLDPVAIADIRNLINDLKKEHTILFSSHQLHDVELLCSDITLINHGEIVVSGEMDTILESLKTNRSFKAKVINFDDSKKKKLMESFDIATLDSESNSDHESIILRMTTKGKIDQRTDLTRFLAESSIGLLEFSEERYDLEELFKRID